MDLRGELQLASKCICQNDHLSPAEETLCKRIMNLTKERDELISEERELTMVIKQRKEHGKNIPARFKSVLNHPKTITTQLTPLTTLEKRKRSVSASLTVLGRQLVTLDQRIIDARDQRLAEIEEKSLVGSQHSTGSLGSGNQFIIQLVHWTFCS